MKALHTVALLSCLTAFSGTVLAGGQASLLGTWVGKSNAAVHGQHQVETKEKSVRFSGTDLTIVIEREQGRNFSGYLMYKSTKEPISGAFMVDLINGVYVDSDGAGIFKRIGQNQLDMCYTQTPVKTTDFGIASCVTYDRK